MNMWDVSYEEILHESVHSYPAPRRVFNKLRCVYLCQHDHSSARHQSEELYIFQSVIHWRLSPPQCHLPELRTRESELQRGGNQSITSDTITLKTPIHEPCFPAPMSAVCLFLVQWLYLLDLYHYLKKKRENFS